MASQSTSFPSTSTSGVEASSSSDVRKRATQNPNMAATKVTPDPKKIYNAAKYGHSSAMSYEEGEEPLLPKSDKLAFEDAKLKSKTPKKLDLSISNVYYTHSQSGKSSLGSPSFPTACDLM
ncbi:hypothetical protein MMC07_003359 [Pseudocyphellaria aurata]|nr:hypothetical protein [Pseudocyphellaria aurata]